MSLQKAKIEQFDDYRIVRGERYGNAMVLNTRWADRFLKIVAKYRITDIRVCDQLGWLDSDLSFLKSIPNLRRVSVISDSATDVSPAFRIKKLEALSLWCSKAAVAGDFTELQHLEELGLSWR